MPQQTLNPISFLWAAYLLMGVAQVVYVGILYAKRQKLKQTKR